MRVSMTKNKWQATVELLEEVANAIHRDLSGDERKILGDQLISLVDDLRERAGLPSRQSLSNPIE